VAAARGRGSRCEQFARHARQALAIAARARVVGLHHAYCRPPCEGLRILRLDGERTLEQRERTGEVVPVLRQLRTHDQQLGRSAGRFGKPAQRRLGVADVAGIALGLREIEMTARQGDRARRIARIRGQRGAQAAQFALGRIAGARRQPLEDRVVRTGNAGGRPGGAGAGEEPCGRRHHDHQDGRRFHEYFHIIMWL